MFECIFMFALFSKADFVSHTYVIVQSSQSLQHVMGRKDGICNGAQSVVANLGRSGLAGNGPVRPGMADDT